MQLKERIKTYTVQYSCIYTIHDVFGFKVRNSDKFWDSVQVVFINMTNRLFILIQFIGGTIPATLLTIIKLVCVIRGPINDYLLL